jgi:hypothetical protein
MIRPYPFGEGRTMFLKVRKAAKTSGRERWPQAKAQAGACPHGKGVWALSLEKGIGQSRLALGVTRDFPETSQKRLPDSFGLA